MNTISSERVLFAAVGMIGGYCLAKWSTSRGVPVKVNTASGATAAANKFDKFAEEGSSTSTQEDGSGFQEQVPQANRNALDHGSKPIQTVLVLIAMEEEAAPFIKKHSLKRLHVFEPLPFEGFEGYCGDMKVYLTWTGSDKRFKVNNVATTASTLSCYASLTKFPDVDLVISAGTCGGFQQAGGHIADVYLSSKCVFHSRRIQGTQGYEEYGFGHFRSPPCELLAEQVGCKIGVVSTSDSLDHTARDLQIMRQEGAHVKEMEAAAIAWVCLQMNMPFFALKSVTDIVDGEIPSHIEFEENLRSSSDTLQTKLSAILTLMAGKPLSAWHLR
eukprot:m.100978 g.100978  ORF g.100978 m.100978 type:complete len:330 (+) comp16786_c0_seq1:239-1228(+)